MSILRNFLEHVFYRTPIGDCFCLEWLCQTLTAEYLTPKHLSFFQN